MQRGILSHWIIRMMFVCLICERHFFFFFRIYCTLVKWRRHVNGGSVMTLKNATLTQSDSWVVKQNRYSLIRSKHPSSIYWMTMYTTASLAREHFTLCVSPNAGYSLKYCQHLLFLLFLQYVQMAHETFKYCKT